MVANAAKLVCVVCVVCLVTSFAVADGLAKQPTDEAAAESLFVEGRRLLADGKLKEACIKFQASDKASPSVGARMNLGDCQKAQGKTASAYATYRSAESLAHSLGDVERRGKADAAAKSIEAKLTYVTIVVAEADRAPGLRVTIDGVEKNQALWGQRLPVDPGTLEISASAAGYETWSQKANARAPSATVRIEVPPLKKVAAVKTPIAEPIAQPNPSEPAVDTIDDSGRQRRLIGIGVAAGGAAFAATGLVFGILARSKYDERKDHCDVTVTPNACSPEGLEIIDSAGQRATIATVLVGAGLVAVGVGAALYLTAPKGEPATSFAIDARRDSFTVGLTRTF